MNFFCRDASNEVSHAPRGVCEVCFIPDGRTDRATQGERTLRKYIYRYASVQGWPKMKDIRILTLKVGQCTVINEGEINYSMENFFFFGFYARFQKFRSFHGEKSYF